MSKSQSTSERDASLPTSDSYPRENWWGEDLDDTDTDPSKGVGHDPAPFEYHAEKAAWAAHGMLKDTADILSATTLFEDPYHPGGEIGQSLAYVLDGECNPHNELAVHESNHEVEMSDPEVHVPSESPRVWGCVDYGQSRHRMRVDEEHGYIGRIMIADQPEDEFLEAVYGLIDWWSMLKDLREQEAAKLRRDARRLKRAGDHRDVDIVERLLRDVMTDSIMEGNA